MVSDQGGITTACSGRRFAPPLMLSVSHKVAIQHSERVVYLPATPPIVLRERRGRLFEEIPPGEWTEAADRVRETRPLLQGEQLIRAVCEVMGIRRVTENIRGQLLKRFGD
jgi:hypothetical protein